MLKINISAFSIALLVVLGSIQTHGEQVQLD